VNETTFGRTQAIKRERRRKTPTRPPFSPPFQSSLLGLSRRAVANQSGFFLKKNNRRPANKGGVADSRDVPSQRSSSSWDNACLSMRTRRVALEECSCLTPDSEGTFATRTQQRQVRSSNKGPFTVGTLANGPWSSAPTCAPRVGLEDAWI